MHGFLWRGVAIQVIYWKCIIPLKIFFSSSRHRSDKLSITLWWPIRVYQTLNFMTPRVRVIMLGRGHISHYSAHVLSSTLSKCSTLLAIVIRNYDAVFLFHGWFLFMIGMLISRYDPFSQEISVESLIVRWPLRP